jgi:hypothetical protein
MPGTSKWSPSLRSPHQNPVCTFRAYMLHACYMPRPYYSSRFGDEYRSLSSSLCSLLHSPVASSLLDPVLYIQIY